MSEARKNIHLSLKTEASEFPLLRTPISSDDLSVGKYEYLLYKVTALSIVSIVLTLSIGFFLRDRGDPLMIGGWVLLTLMLPIAAWWKARRAGRVSISPEKARRELKNTYIHSVVMGILWGGTVFVFTRLFGDIDLMILVLVVVGITAGIAAIIPQVPLKCVLFSLIALPPVFWNLFVHGSEQTIIFSWLIIIFLIMLSYLVMANYAHFKSNLRIRLALRATHILLDDAINNMGEGFAVYGTDGDLLYENQMHRDLFPSGHAAPLPPLKNEYVETLADGRIIKGMARLTQRGALVSVYRDITHAHQQEEALLAARLEAESANRAKSQFLAVMSHELRTPLNSIIGFADLIRSDNINPGRDTIREYGDYIKQSGTHLLGLISQVLDLSRIETGRFELSEGVVNLSAVVRSVANSCKPLAKEAGIKIIVRTKDDLTLWADEHAIRQILFNLLSNAIKFSYEGGLVYVETIYVDGRAGIEVRDDGVGIPEEDIGLIFKPFHQADNSLTRKHEGSGLGLPLVYNLTDLHGGDIDVRSKAGSGTTMCVLFAAERLIKESDDKRLHMTDV